MTSKFKDVYKLDQKWHAIRREAEKKANDGHAKLIAAAGRQNFTNMGAAVETLREALDDFDQLLGCADKPAPAAKEKQVGRPVGRPLSRAEKRILAEVKKDKEEKAAKKEEDTEK